ncbi:hypothetical protein GH714_030059 [Hevea brasiliensis]|uniref:RING-type E3 ubiquitin transferase n=1 Tax=Hevea brasiliensis TaxID=3981 RepID=A0A6A6MQ49_HEVBR|nr:hypothetical protein GH714_030059 [Hevea brasiliensis]
MIQRFVRTDRRILTFPAVHPCEGISPGTLLSSLIELSQKICNYQSNFFATQRRNAREAIRQIGILLIFFEEIRDRRLVLSDSAVLCFSELHLTFQKIQFLFEDCTREGARLCILMKSKFIATQFRVLIRAIATALDVLPLNRIDVGGEVKELVELVSRQARKAKFELDPEDECASKQVLFILNYLEKGIEPQLSFLKRVLDYLEIRNWSDCAKEVKFLEEEIGFQCSDCDEREVPFLSSLLGLMSYSRAVIFETLDYRNNDQIDVRCNMETLSCLNPEDFRCPISLELMLDPVTVSTGQTYDRSSIEKWFKAGNMICPKTGERLKNTELVPNTTFRKFIQQEPPESSCIWYCSVAIEILCLSDKDGLVADSLAVVAALAENVDGAVAILRTSALSIITRNLQSLTSRAGRSIVFRSCYVCVNMEEQKWWRV